MSWPGAVDDHPPDPYDEYGAQDPYDAPGAYAPSHEHRPYQHQHQQQQRLRHVVFLDGLLVDAWAEPVEGTAYWEQARQLDLAAHQPLPRPEPPTPTHERILEWLDSVVGGRTALLALDDRPLAPVTLPADSGGFSGVVAQQLASLCRAHFDDEVLQAARGALVSLERTPDVLTGTPAEVAVALCWMVGRANGCAGAGAGVTQQLLKRQLELKGEVSSRAARFRDCLRDLQPLPPGFRPNGCPNLLELGSAAYLTSTTRRELVHLRDRALAAAATAAADERARVAAPLA